MFLKNERDVVVVAKFDGKEISFGPGQVVQIDPFIPEHQRGQAAAHFTAKYGLKAAEKPEEKAADPQEAPAGAITGPDKKAGKKKG